MPFPTYVIVTLTKEASFSCPPEDFRKEMVTALENYFLEGLQQEPWGDIEATLGFVVQQKPIYKENRMMVKLRSIHENRDSGEFDFKVFLTKRPEEYSSWNLDDPESDEEEAELQNVTNLMNIFV